MIMKYLFNCVFVLLLFLISDMLHMYDIKFFIQLRRTIEQEWPWTDTLCLTPSKSQSSHQGLQGATCSDSLSLTFSSPSTLPSTHYTRPTSPLLFLICQILSLRIFVLLISGTLYPLINCLTSFKTVLKCHFLSESYPDYPIKNCNSHPYTHTFLILVLLRYFCP